MRRNFGKFACFVLALCVTCVLLLAPALAIEPPEASEYDGYLVQLRAEPAESGLSTFGVSETQLRKVAGPELLYVADSIEATNHYVHAGLVEEIYPNYRLELLGVPNDPYYTANTQWHFSAIGMPWVWNNAPTLIGTEEIRVAVIDSGISPTHPDLTQTRVIYSRDYTGESSDPKPAPAGHHGTLVAGVIAATTNNGLGVASIAPGVTLVSMKVFYTKDGNITANVEHLITAIYEAVNVYNCDVLNMSLGFKTERDGPYPPVTDALEYAASKGALLVAAVGNDGGDPTLGGIPEKEAQYRRNYPASNAVVVGVAASDKAGKVAAFSQRNDTALLSAPGVEIASTSYTAGGNTYGAADGTSLASPVVAAVGALLKQRYPDLTQAQFMKLLCLTAKPFTAGGAYNQYGGAGILDVAELMQTDLLSFGTGGAAQQATYWPRESNPVGTPVRLLAAEYDASGRMVDAEQYTVQNTTRGVLLWIAPEFEGGSKLKLFFLDPSTWVPKKAAEEYSES